jgi:hypothetical protein
VFCRKCHYDLSHTANNRCPECGRGFDPKCPETFLSEDTRLSRATRRVRHICLFRGVLIPLALIIYGIWCLATQQSFLPGLPRGGLYRTMPLSGGPAIAMGIAWLGCALALAGAYLLGRLDTYWRVAPIAVFAGCTLVVLGWGYALVWAIATVFA